MKELDKIIEDNETVFWEGKPNFWPFTLSGVLISLTVGLIFLIIGIYIFSSIFEIIDDKLKNKLGVESGVQITALSAGKLLSAGIKEGFIITSIDKKKIDSLDDVKAALENKEGGVLIEGIYPNGMKAYYAFGI